MKSESKLLANLKGFKVWIPFIIGIAVATFLLVKNLKEVRFVEVPEEVIGTHVWIDYNNNGEVDYWLEEEFELSVNGNYRRQNVWDILADIHWSWKTLFFVFFAVLMTIVRDIGYIIRIRLLTDKFLTWKRSFVTIMMWEFASAMSPGIVGGAAFAMFILNKEKVPMGRATAIVVSTAFLDNLFFVIAVPIIVTLVGLPIMLGDFSSDVSMGFAGVFWLGYALIVAVTALLFISLFYYPKFIKSILLFFAKLPLIKRYKEKLHQTGEDIVQTSREFSSRNFRFWLKAFGATLLSWIGRFLVINMILAAFLSIGLTDHLVVISKQFVLWIMMLVSPTPGASGVAEWGFTRVLGSFATSSLLISSLAILWRLIGYFPYLFIGSLMLPKWLKRRNN